MNKRSGGRNHNQDQIPSGQNRKKRRRSRNRADPRKFWGNIDNLPEPIYGLPTPKATQAVLASLGKPPIPGQETPSLEFLNAIYDRSAGLAFALAAAGGLDQPPPEGTVEEPDPINTVSDADPFNQLEPEDGINGNQI
ncbi:MAG: hypothetical protein QF596_05695 [Acidimicrobiales bacterium]|jgi:hypothetical protein|nr:hypothetical protein [Acidimicrobiales bacterium]MDP6298779.1 hypothetical protein [Acidimicrobiales bacterium]HJM28558.1 hypothetical protein [Acidimicrobiales bacterium]HJM97085.1 hypothetical protein [Acidimicrobiales bacterium]